MNVNNFASIEQITGQYINSRTASDKNVKDTHISFTQALDNAKSLHSSEVTFSKHASERLKTRNISLTDNQLNRLNEGARKAQNKGITESLVLLDDLAFIVNTKKYPARKEGVTCLQSQQGFIYLIFSSCPDCGMQLQHQYQRTALGNSPQPTAVRLHDM